MNQIKSLYFTRVNNTESVKMAFISDDNKRYSSIFSPSITVKY